MKQFLITVAIFLANVLLLGVITTVSAKASNESSYQLGYSQGLQGSDIGNTCVKSSFQKSLTNTTSCEEAGIIGASTAQVPNNVFRIFLMAIFQICYSKFISNI